MTNVLTPGSHRLRTLSRDECVARLLNSPIGRLGISSAAVPLVVPVHFTLDGETVVVATTPGTRLFAATRNRIVAFEADGYDPEGGVWNVIVVGTATHLTDVASARLASLGLLPRVTWDPSAEQVVYVAVRPEHVLGHQIGPSGPV